MSETNDPIETQKTNPEEEKQKNSKRIFFIILIVVLALINGLLYYNNLQTKKEKEIVEIKLESADSLRAELEVEYNKALAQLEQYKGENAQLDSMLQEKIQELNSEKERIEKMLRGGNLSRAELAQAKSRIAELVKERESFVAKIDSLSAENRLLRTEKETLTERLNLEKEHVKNIESEKQRLKTLGSVLQVGNVSSSGINVKGNKEIPTLSARKSDKLKICFDVKENKIADPGTKDFFVRVLNEAGGTITTQGSEKIKVESGQEVLYTTKVSLEYNNTKQNACSIFKPDTDLKGGNYKVEIYNEGILVGNGSFDLKSGIF